MIRDFIGSTKKQNFLELIPEKDFYTSMRAMEQASIKDGKEDPFDVIVSSVCIQEGCQVMQKQVSEVTKNGVLTSSILIGNPNLKVDSEGHVLDAQRNVFVYYSPAIVNLTIQDGTGGNDQQTLSLRKPAIVYNKVTEQVISVLPGIPFNISEEYGKNFVNSSNLASKCRSIVTLLFGKNRLTDDWLNSHIILLTPEGARKIYEAYENLKQNAGSKETSTFECTEDIFN